MIRKWSVFLICVWEEFQAPALCSSYKYSPAPVLHYLCFPLSWHLEGKIKIQIHSTARATFEMQGVSFTTSTDTQNNYLNISHNNDKEGFLFYANLKTIKGACKYRDVSPLHPSIWMLIFSATVPNLENTPIPISKCSTSTKWKQDPERGTQSLSKHVLSCSLKPRSSAGISQI